MHTPRLRMEEPNLSGCQLLEPVSVLSPCANAPGTLTGSCLVRRDLRAPYGRSSVRAVIGPSERSASAAPATSLRYLLRREAEARWARLSSRTAESFNDGTILKNDIQLM
ncbi:hypothetical protein EVAR_22975_1 [Eumeta japonica]|uniref:Uncharacterized protein n=1 Tax=Eumeta variegata TaxID=151549 RepID=A0A4C1URA8_EUMVA|nr:hypothetical protein EVAR_22975_1 [Eumeta japonica]